MKYIILSLKMVKLRILKPVKQLKNTAKKITAYTAKKNIFFTNNQAMQV